MGSSAEFAENVYKLEPMQVSVMSKQLIDLIFTTVDDAAASASAEE